MDFQLPPENPLTLVLRSVNIYNKNIKFFKKTYKNVLTLYILYVTIKLRRSKSNAAGGDSICLIKINLEQRSLKMDLL